MWAWALSLLGYDFYLAKDAALRVLDEESDTTTNNNNNQDGSLVTPTPLRECGCAPGLAHREVALALEALEKWALRTRGLWEALRGSARGRRG